MPKKGALPEAPAGAGAGVPEQFDMVFHVQLAHGSPTRQVRDFTNVKQLYESIAKAFGIATSDVSGPRARRPSSRRVAAPGARTLHLSCPRQRDRQPRRSTAGEPCPRETRGGCS